jgi:uncharacterized membrane protein YeaQ/YmgE (transglycosylase-associated protein family)
VYGQGVGLHGVQQVCDDERGKPEWAQPDPEIGVGMTVTGIITMIVVGLIVGALGRVVVPGRHPIPLWLTVVVGIVAAFIGTWLAGAFGISTATPGIDWLELLFQIVLAAIGVLVVARLYSRRRVGPSTYRVAGEPPSRPRRMPLSSPTPPTSWSAAPSIATDPLRPRADGPSRQPASTSREQQPAYREPEVDPTAAPTRIFMSYRRTDSRYAARGIADRLRSHFGRTEVFMDVDSLDAGVDFVEGVLRAINASAIVLVLIGDRWLVAEDNRGQRRLDDPTDNVRREIEQALRCKKPLLPVLLDGAHMPRPDELPGSLALLPRLNGMRIDHVSWDVDVDMLIQAVTRLRS